MLVDLGNVDVDGDEFPPRFAVLRDSVLRHAAREEATILPLLERTRDDESLRRMVTAFALV